MSEGSDLLRMLEPAVRPGGVPGPVRSKPNAGPIETRDFESLLAEAQEEGVEDELDGGRKTETNESKTIEREMMMRLSQVDRVENSSVVGLFAGDGSQGVDAEGSMQEPSTKGDL